MIIGTGLDAVSVPRLRAFLDRWSRRGLERLFTEEERRYCDGLLEPAPSLAARFAAKEAFFKALGTGWGRGGDWREVGIERDELGRPSLRLSGRAQRVARSRGVKRIHLSLTHTAEVALAQVVLEE